jgi:hypothetical protein
MWFPVTFLGLKADDVVCSMERRAVDFSRTERPRVLEKPDMAVAFDRKHFQLGAHHRVWLIVAGVLAFLLAALWSQPVY